MTYIRAKLDKKKIPRKSKVLVTCICGCAREFYTTQSRLESGHKYFNRECFLKKFIK